MISYKLTSRNSSLRYPRYTDMTVTLDAYKQMSQTQRNQIKKNELMALLEETLDENNIVTKLDVIINELKLITEKNEKQDAEIKRLERTIDDQSKVLSAHQKFMEDLDSEKRAKHLIVLSLKEGGTSDKDKFLGILDAIGVKREEVKIECMERLGQIDEDQVNRTRPLKITLEQRSMRNTILKNSKNLKDQPEGSQLKRVFLKRDQHPDIRKEEKRLYEVFKTEKNKPENADKVVVFDRKSRVVTVNNEEIDRFKLFAPFH